MPRQNGTEPRRKPARRPRGLAAAVETAMGGSDPRDSGENPVSGAKATPAEPPRSAAPSRAKTVARKRSAAPAPPAERPLAAERPREPIAAAADDTLLSPVP